ncbi:MAG: flavodoxin family protein [Tissierellia bacterium]|nr:NAD(P)H-dependent oxidoreductase [Bacillota bacterium]NLL23106.1 flavodoxin family protein [Tissierellia bacterium]
MIVIVSDDSGGNWGTELEEAVFHTGNHVVRFAANSLDIKPCTACGNCSGKTYGRCIIPDDMQKVLPKIAGCRTLVLISPVVFGGVSHHIKKVMDRMAAVGNPRYRVNGGELVKGMSGSGMNYFMVGIGDKLKETQRSAFISLHEENRKIMSAKGKAFILDEGANKASMIKIAQEIVHEQV